MAVQIVLIAAKIKGRGVRKGGEGEKEHKLAFGFVTSYQIPVPISHVLGESFHNVIVDPVGELLLLVLHAIPTNNTAVLRTALRAWPRGLLLVAACATKGGDGSYYKNVLKFILCVGRHVGNCLIAVLNPKKVSPCKGGTSFIESGMFWLGRGPPACQSLWKPIHTCMLINMILSSRSLATHQAIPLSSRSHTVVRSASSSSTPDRTEWSPSPTRRTSDGFYLGGPDHAPQPLPSPDTYLQAIDAKWYNQIFMNIFTSRLSEAVGRDPSTPGYNGVVDLTRALNQKYPDTTELHTRTTSILLSLFPHWLPKAFGVMFAKPFPRLSYTLNAVATYATCQWLMGPLEINDVEMDDGQVGTNNGVLVHRCRYLEESGCVSVCVNSCKIPTQAFFNQHMSLPLTMSPNYDDFSCQFSFGKTPGDISEDPAFKSPCFDVCPSKRRAETEAEGCHKFPVET